MRINITLSNTDLIHIRSLVHEKLQRASQRTDDEIIRAAITLLEKIRPLTLSDFVAQKMQMLELLVRMLNDKDWQIPQLERTRVLTALSYFSDPHDLIPDEIPVLGLLDDAIIIELMVRELKHEIDAFIEFCEFREDHTQTLPPRTKSPSQPTANESAEIIDKRQTLHQRMRAQHDREQRANSSQHSLF